ncbi:hypothetical protein DFH07DRAFT_1007762, partial [Mycena maculata]
IELTSQKKGMKKSINPQVCSLIAASEMALKKMFSTVMKDKEKIEDTIAELDRYKREALESRWKRGLMGALLPGNFAKLQPPEDQDLMDSFKVKVQ